MSTFSFTIPQDAISAGVPASNTEVIFDKGFSRTPTFQVLNAQFGDGYEQRVQDGINAKRETYSISFAKRPAAEVNLIAAYLDTKIAQNITLTITDLSGDSTVKAVCDTYNITYIHELYHSMTATFRRVYEV